MLHVLKSHMFKYIKSDVPLYVIIKTVYIVFQKRKASYSYDVVQHYQDIDGKMQMPKYHSTLLHSVCFKRSIHCKASNYESVKTSL